MDDTVKQDLWRYALGRWQDKAFEQACLTLQDTYQVPVSLLLCGLWLAATGKQPDAMVGRRVAEVAEQFEVKRQLQQVELEGERWLLTTLPSLCDNLLPAGGQVDPMAWMLVLVPELAQCEGLQDALNVLVELKVQL